MGAEGRGIRRRLRQELHDLGFGEARFFPGNPHPHLLPGDGVLHEDHETVHPAQGFAAKGQLFYAQIDFRALGQRGGRRPLGSPGTCQETWSEKFKVL